MPWAGWVYGNGGHGKVVQNMVAWWPPSIIDDSDPKYPWKPEYVKQDGFVAIGDNATRKLIVQKLLAIGVHFKVMFFWQPSPGTVVMTGGVIQRSGTTIGEHCIINTSASVDHDCNLGDFVHIAPGAHLCGNVRVGEGTLVGAGTIVTPGVIIGPWLVIPAGSVITKDCMNENDVAALRRR